MAEGARKDSEKRPGKAAKMNTGRRGVERSKERRWKGARIIATSCASAPAPKKWQYKQTRQPFDHLFSRTIGMFLFAASCASARHLSSAHRTKEMTRPLPDALPACHVFGAVVKAPKR